MARIYREAVVTLGPEAYSAEQVASWAAFASDAGFASWVLDIPTWVAEAPGGVLGFAGLRDDGYLASLYVRPDATRQGIGTLLLRHLLEHARSRRMARVEVAASHFSRPLLERHGFVLREVEEVVRDGVVFRRPWLVLELPTP